MAKKTNIVIDQNASFSYAIKLDGAGGIPFDVTGYIATAMMRKSYSSLTATTFTCVLETGLLTLSLTKEQTALLVPGRYVYDVFLFAGNAATKIAVGIVTVTAAATHS